MLSPLTDPVTALLKPSSGFHLRAEAEALPVGQAALHPLSSHSAGVGDFVIYPSLSPNPSTLASWILSEHARHSSALLPHAGMLFSYGIHLAGFLLVSAQVSLC